MRIKKGDIVKVISGKDKGFKGEVLNVLAAKNRLVVDGANLVKKHLRGSGKDKKGQRVEVPAPLDVSKVLLYCNKCEKGVRFGIKIEEDVKKRICKKCGHEL
jgi:large subunit ribosomal protein L24